MVTNIIALFNLNDSKLLIDDACQLRIEKKCDRWWWWWWPQPMSIIFSAVVINSSKYDYGHTTVHLLQFLTYIHTPYQNHHIRYSISAVSLNNRHQKYSMPSLRNSFYMTLLLCNAIPSTSLWTPSGRIIDCPAPFQRLLLIDMTDTSLFYKNCFVTRACSSPEVFRNRRKSASSSL